MAESSSSSLEVGTENVAFSEDHIYIKPSSSGQLDTDVIINNGALFVREESPTLQHVKTSKDGEHFTEENNNKDGGFQQKFVVQRRKRFQVSYEYTVWSVFFIVTFLCIADRFINKGDIVLERKGKRVSKMWGKSFAETLTNVIWGITARLIITSQNLMFYTTLWCFPNMLSEFAPRILKINGVRDVHIKIHRIAGIFLMGIPSLAHVLIIFLPPLVDKSQLTYSPPCSFNYSTQLGHLNWTKFWDPAAVNNWSFNDPKGVHLTADEIFRFTLMILLFCVLFPLSRSQFLNDRSYSLGVALHVFAGVMYSVDNIRKITHGLSHVMNLPFLILWCLDRLISILWYHTSPGRIISHSVVGDSKYVEVRVKLDKPTYKGTGDVYYLKFKSRDIKSRGIKSFFERSHPFTSYSNHSGTDRTWDIGFLITVMDDTEQWCPAWTRRLCTIEGDKEESDRVQTWGPYRSSVSQLFFDIQSNEHTEYVLLASGSGFGYILDVLGVLAHKSTRNFPSPRVDVYYTVRDASVIHQFSERVDNFLTTIDKRNTAKVSFRWFYTGNEANAKFTFQHKQISVTKGRINLENVVKGLSKHSSVYFVGRPSFADRVERICRKYDVPVTKDFTNSQRGQSDKTVSMMYLRRTSLVLTCAVGFCILLSLYVNIKKI